MHFSGIYKYIYIYIYIIIYIFVSMGSPFGPSWARAYSTEASLKYFVLGAVSSGLFLFGCVLLYGLTGTTSSLPRKRATSKCKAG